MALCQQLLLETGVQCVGSMDRLHAGIWELSDAEITAFHCERHAVLRGKLLLSCRNTTGVVFAENSANKIRPETFETFQ